MCESLGGDGVGVLDGGGCVVFWWCEAPVEEEGHGRVGEEVAADVEFAEAGAEGADHGGEGGVVEFEVAEGEGAEGAEGGDGGEDGGVGGTVGGGEVEVDEGGEVREEVGEG